MQASQENDTLPDAETSENLVPSKGESRQGNRHNFYYTPQQIQGLFFFFFLL